MEAKGRDRGRNKFRTTAAVEAKGLGKEQPWPFRREVRRKVSSGSRSVKKGGFQPLLRQVNCQHQKPSEIIDACGNTLSSRFVDAAGVRCCIFVDAAGGRCCNRICLRHGLIVGFCRCVAR